MLWLKEYNKLEIETIIKEYKHMPDNKEVNKWIKKYAESFKEIIKEWYETADEVYNILHKK